MRQLSEVEIDNEAHRLPVSTIVIRLVELVGVMVTGTIGGTKAERTVRDWAKGTTAPEREAQLRFAYRIAQMLASVCGPLMVQSWFKGSNSSLGDRSPALLLREDFSNSTQLAILKAARRAMQ